AVVNHPWGYGLRVPVGSVDADEFEGLVSRARGEAPAVAAESLSRGTRALACPAARRLRRHGVRRDGGGHPEIAQFPRTFVGSRDCGLVRSDYRLARIDLRTGDVKTRLALPSSGCCESAGVAIGEGSIWVVGISRSVLWRIDRRGGGDVIAATIHLGGQPA